MSENEKDKIVQRIAKLLSLSKSKNAEEAASAAEKASELMEKYQIQFSEVELKDVQGNDLVTDTYQIPGLKMKYNFLVTLARAAAHAFDAEVLNEKTLHMTRFIYVGRKRDVQNAKQLFDHFYTTWTARVAIDLSSAKGHHSILEADWKPKDTMKFKSSHGFAFAVALLERCDQMAAERKQRVSEASVPGKTLVVQTEEMILKHLKFMGVSTRRVKAPSHHPTGLRMGRKAGRDAALGGSLE